MYVASAEKTHQAADATMEDREVAAVRQAKPLGNSGKGDGAVEKPRTTSLGPGLLTEQAEESRQQHRRAKTTDDISRSARELLAAGGPSAVTLPGVARGAGITPAAIYRSYSGLDSLVEALRADLCAELQLFLESARDEAPSTNPADRISKISLSLHGWALDRRAEFALIFSPPIAAQPDPEGGRKCDPDTSIGVLIVDELVGMWLVGQRRSPTEAAQACELDGYLRPILARRYPELPVSIIDAALIVWLKLRGLLMTEVFGQLTLVAEAGQWLFQLEVADLIDRFTAERSPA